MVRANDMDVFEGIDSVVHFSGNTEIWHGLPNKERFVEGLNERCPTRLDTLDQINTTGWSAYQME